MANAVIDSNPAEAGGFAFFERRRPGRPSSVSPDLLPVLRGTPQLSPDALEPQFGDPDQLRPARGMAAAIVCSLVLWALLGASIWFAVTVLWGA